MSQQSFFSGLDQGLLVNYLVSEGVPTENIQPYDPVRPYSVPKEIQKNYMQDIADNLRVKFGDMVAIIIVRDSVKNGIRGHHAEIYRNYHAPYKEALQKRYVYPDMVFDRSANVLIISEHAFNLADTVKISMNYFHAVVVQNEVVGETVWVSSDAPKRLVRGCKGYAAAPLEYDVSFTLEDIIDAISTIQPDVIFDEIALYSNNHDLEEPDYILPKSLPFGRRHLVTRYPFILVKAKSEDEFSEFLFNPQTGFAEKLDYDESLTGYLVKNVMYKMLKGANEKLIRDSIGMRMPIHAVEDKYITFLKSLAMHMINDIDLDIIDAEIRGTDIFSDRCYMGLYISANASKHQPIKLREEKFRGRVMQKRKDKFSLIIDHQWMHDSHHAVLALVLLDEMAMGMAQKLNYFGRGLLTRRDPSWLACAVLLKSIMMDHQLDAHEFKEKFFVSENIEETAEALGISAGDEFIRLMDSLPKGFVEYVTSAKITVSNNSDSILEAAKEMMDALWRPRISDIQKWRGNA